MNISIVDEDQVGLFRSDHQGTSVAAAIDVYARSGTQRRRVFDFITEAGKEGATRDEIALALDMSPNTARPRVKELIDFGLVGPSGAIRPTPLGRDAEVLVVLDFRE